MQKSIILIFGFIIFYVIYFCTNNEDIIKDNVVEEFDIEEFLEKEPPLLPIKDKSLTNDEYKDFIEKNRYYNTVEKTYQIKDKNFYKGKKIKDIYDNLTRNDIKYYSKKCLKEPHIDPYSHKPVYFSKNSRTINNNQWEYHNENVMNGGNFCGLTGFDPSEDKQEVY